MPRKLDNFPDAVWDLFRLAGEGSEQMIPFGPQEHGPAVSVVHMLRSFRRALLDGAKGEWGGLEPEKRAEARRLKPLAERVTVLGPALQAGGGWAVRLVANWKAPVMEYLGRARTEHIAAPPSPALDAEAAESQAALLRKLGLG